MKRKAPNAGFTLIEILLVVAIIGILASIIVVGVITQRNMARDARRIIDLRSISTALELFFNDHGRYPIAVGWVTGCSLSGANWISDGVDVSWSGKYISAMPRDPSENCGTTNQRYYAYKSDGATYQLTAQLEDPPPPAVGGQTFSYNGSYFQPVVDATPITVSFSSPASDPTNLSPIPLIISFSREVVDFTVGSLSIARGIVTGFSPILASIFNIFVTPTDNYTVIVSLMGGAVHDQNGVGNAEAQFTITYDSLAPHVALSPDPLPESVAGPFSVNVNFTVPVIDFSVDTISVTNGTVTGFNRTNGSNYSFQINPTAAGVVSVSIPGGVAHSAAGNANVSSNSITTTYTP